MSRYRAGYNMRYKSKYYKIKIIPYIFIEFIDVISQTFKIYMRWELILIEEQCTDHQLNNMMLEITD